MDREILDQARGLRRLLSRRPLEEVVFCSALDEPGRPWALLNLASALQLAGAGVLVVDAAAGKPGGALQTGVARERLEVALKEQDLTSVVTYGPEEIPLLGLQSLHDWPRSCSTQPSLSIRSAHGETTLIDMVLINAPAGDERVLAECVSRHHDIILSVRPLRPSVLKTYALIQSQQALPHSAHFRILVSGTLRAREACRLYEALSLAAKRAPHLELSYLGLMPAERYLLSAALRGRTVVKSDPHTWTAKSFRQMADALLRQPLRSDVRDSTLDGLVAS